MKLLITLALVSAAVFAHAQTTAKQQNDAAAISAFESITPVLHHPRCMNCHSVGDYPRQGNDSHPHTMQVHRGADGYGTGAVKCNTCHQTFNVEGLHTPPGAPGWHLPPPSNPLIWRGLTDHQLCELIKDQSHNGHRNLDQLIEHMRSPLVMWGWTPGEGRTPVPMPHDEFMAKFIAWTSNGAACPAEKSGAKPQR